MCELKTQPPWITVHTGRSIVLHEPDISQITIEDIAHALSNLCRYTGHVPRFYSVAEHCVIASRLASNENRLECLLHDAAEAYLGDISRPLKMLLPDYKKIEKKWNAAIRKKFKLCEVESDECDRIDGKLCVTELVNLFGPDTRTHPNLKVPVSEAVPNFHFSCWTPKEAERVFLQWFRLLTSKKAREEL